MRVCKTENCMSHPHHSNPYSPCNPYPLYPSYRDPGSWISPLYQQYQAFLCQYSLLNPNQLPQLRITLLVWLPCSMCQLLNFLSTRGGSDLWPIQPNSLLLQLTIEFLVTQHQDGRLQNRQRWTCGLLEVSLIILLHSLICPPLVSNNNFNLFPLHWIFFLAKWIFWWISSFSDKTANLARRT